MSQPAHILGGQEFLEQALAGGRPFAILIGGRQSGKELLVRRFLQNDAIAHAVILSAPTRDRRAFLERFAEQLGFEPFHSAAQDLEQLLLGFAHEQAALGCRTVVVVEEAQGFGPGVFDAIRRIVERMPEQPAPFLFVLTGTASLNRILDSDALRDLRSATCWRYGLDAGNEQQQAVMRPVIEVTLRGKLVDHLLIDRVQLMIGRHSQNDLVLDNPVVSRHHALVVSRNDRVYVVDLGSTNGTLVNGAQVHRRALRDGDVIEVGRFRLRYCQPYDARIPTDDQDADHAGTVVLGPHAIAS